MLSSLPVRMALAIGNVLISTSRARWRLAPPWRAGKSRWLVGHFGTYGAFIGGLLDEPLARLLTEADDVHVVLLGRGAQAFAEKLSGKYPDLRHRLTAKGQDLFPVIVGLRQWGESHFYGPKERHSTLVDRSRNRPVRRMEVLARDGKVLKPEDTFVRKVDS